MHSSNIGYLLPQSSSIIIIIFLKWYWIRKTKDIQLCTIISLQVTGSHDRTLKIWDLHHRTCKEEIQPNPSKISPLTSTLSAYRRIILYKSTLEMGFFFFDQDNSICPFPFQVPGPCLLVPAATTQWLEGEWDILSLAATLTRESDSGTSGTCGTDSSDTCLWLIHMYMYLCIIAEVRVDIITTHVHNQGMGYRVCVYMQQCYTHVCTCTQIGYRLPGVLVVSTHIRDQGIGYQACIQQYYTHSYTCT